MSEFAPPTGPPPPAVPPGWKAVWNDQYKQYFYVNIHTKASQWEAPTHPAYAENEGGLDEPPPGYTGDSNAAYGSDTKKPLESNNPYVGNQQGLGAGETDEALARRLQAEEQARSSNRADGGRSPLPGTQNSSNDYYGAGAGAGTYGQPQSPGYQSGYPAQTGAVESSRSSKAGGLFGKLKQKLAPPGGGMHGYPPSHQQHYGVGGYPPQQYGGYPPHGQYGMVGGYPQQHGYGYGHQPMYMQQRRKPGMGAGGAAALGVGGGMLGGMMLANAMDGNDDYQDGYQDGAGDFGGGDDGGGGD